MTVPTTMLSETDLTLIREVHGHLCPMVLLGARTARMAVRLVAGEESEASLYGYYRGYGCAVDGIQLFSGCTWGNGNLVLLRGRNFSFILTKEGSSEGVMVTPQPHLLDKIRGEKTPESKTSLMQLLGSAPEGEILRSGTVKEMGALSGFPGD